MKEMLGTNPFTVGIPTFSDPVILDMSSTQITWGNLLVAKQNSTNLPIGAALDRNGDPTIDPQKAMEGGLLPFGGYKGSGLAFIVELLGGALTSSRVGYNVDGGWGSLFFLVDPNMIRPIDDFKKDVESAIDELKNLPKQKDVDEIFYPGEQSNRKRAECLTNGEIEVNDKLYDELKLIFN
jgi:L-2-hydroxycarboxylate dehydrogenase (NAD+)